MTLCATRATSASYPSWAQLLTVWDSLSRRNIGGGLCDIEGPGLDRRNFNPRPFLWRPALLGDAFNYIEAVYAADSDTQDGQFLFARLRNPAAVALCSQLQLSRRSSSLDAPYDPTSTAEQLTAHPTVPYLTLCDAGMGYHLPSCLRVLELAHPPSAGDAPYPARGHAANRISSLVDSGKPCASSSLKTKYASVGDADASAVAATDELSKSSAYLTDAVFPGNARLYLASSASSTLLIFVAFIPILVMGDGNDPTRAPFNYAFGCGGVGYFAWLVGGERSGAAPGRSVSVPALGRKDGEEGRGRARAPWEGDGGDGGLGGAGAGVAWLQLGIPRGSVVVDVGGGIGSTSMLLASAHAEVDEIPLTLVTGSGGLRFVIQDQPVVVEMGEQAWRAKCPELLDSGAVRFQVHDFFPQPVTDAAVFLLRVVLHDWPDAFAHPILLCLREAAAPHAKLALADFVLPLACVDDFGVGEGGMDVQVEDAEKMLANLGKASANAYWMDLTMQVTFNGQERTLREIVALALTAGWKVVRVTKASGSLFGHIIAVPIALPVSPQRRARAGSGSAFFDVPRAGGTAGAGNAEVGEMEMVERASSRCGTPTFGSRVDLPSVAEARARFGGGVVGTRRPFVGSRAPPPPPPLKQTVVLTGPPVRKKPSPLSVAPPPSSPSPNLPSYRPATSPRPPPAQQHQQQYASPITRRIPPAPLRTQSQQLQPPALSPVPRQPPPPSPMSPRLSLSHPPTPTPQGNTLRQVPSSPVLKQSYRQHPQPSPSSPVPSRIPALTRRASHAQLQLPQTELRKRSGSIVTPSMVRAAAGGESGLGGGHAYGHGLGSLLLHGRASGGALDFGARRRQRGDGDSEGGDIDDELSVEVCVARAAARAVGACSRGAD
ncbi:hypothetical protein DFH08DRAFT_1080245 [Mycena albidolilacea]|uniref:O-methyltransferase C-terminal domain-containing protein n=1 Tax=Mycena albidolilacea TaxID=1033008 RepID=A0AAD7ERA0_9AGAR|nr:hypothetical protein DFH08DRAFT_1080245 [Mycena albidolilacea]